MASQTEKEVWASESFKNIPKPTIVRHDQQVAYNVGWHNGFEDGKRKFTDRLMEWKTKLLATGKNYTVEIRVIDTLLDCHHNLGEGLIDVKSE